MKYPQMFLKEFKMSILCMNNVYKIKYLFGLHYQRHSSQPIEHFNPALLLTIFMVHILLTITPNNIH